LSVAFIEKGVSILNENGKIGLIIQKRFFKTNYGYDVREFIGSNNFLSQVINFNSTKIFKGRITYVALMILDKSKPDVINCYNASSDVSELPFELNSIPEVEKENQNFTQIQSLDLSSDLWQIEDAEV